MASYYVSTANVTIQDWYATTTPSTWYTWIADTDTTSTMTTATNSTNLYVWNHWAMNWTGDTSAAPIVYQQAAAMPTLLTAEQIAEYRRQVEAQQAERQVEYERLQREAEEATARARALLEESLTEEQRTEYHAAQSFRVISADGERIYRIDQGTHGNVKLLDAVGKVRRSFCIQPGGVPTEDAMLAQKLWLENDEAAFLRVANGRDIA